VVRRWRLASSSDRTVAPHWKRSLAISRLLRPTVVETPTGLLAHDNVVELNV
jgi:hypothetical protein